jgi:hypothetical protein
MELNLLLIRRALKLESHIKIFVRMNLLELKDNELTDDDWDTLRATVEILYPIWNITKRLGGHTKKNERGAMWKALPIIKVLIKYLDKIKQVYTQQTYPELTSSINLAWSKLDNYYKKLDDSPAYAAALLLHPRYSVTG